MAPLLQLVEARPDRTLEELTRVYNRGAPVRVHRSSIVRALERAGYCTQKKRTRPLELDRVSVQQQREAFCAWIQTIAPARLVFLDQSGVNLAMGRSHAWVRRGRVIVEPRPMNWASTSRWLGLCGTTGG